MPPSNESLLEKGYRKTDDANDDGTHTQSSRSWAVTTMRRCLAILRSSLLPRIVSKATKPGRTAWLDGVRGFAALLVYFGHHQLWAHDAMFPEKIFDNAYGYDDHYYFCLLPGVRLFFSGGHFAVATFFVLSGYVLSIKALSLIHAGDQVKLADCLASALFRRWFRLYIPLFVVTFLYLSSWHAFNLTGDSLPQPTYRGELWEWYREFKSFSFIFRTGGKPWFKYNFPAWSIPVEFRGSMVIYTSLLAFSRITRNARLFCQVFLMFYFMYIADGAHYCMFIAGMLMGDLDLLAASGDLPTWLQLQESTRTVIFSLSLPIGIYLSGCPAENKDLQVLRESPGWYYLSFLTPQAVFDYKWFFLFWAAILIIPAIPHFTYLKAFFEHRYNQYLGRISYSFYLIHGPVMWILGDRLNAAVGWEKETHSNLIPGWINLFPIPRVGPLGLELRFWVPQLVLFPFTLWLAEIGTRLIDEPSVRFAQWAYKRSQQVSVKT